MPDSFELSLVSNEAFQEIFQSMTEGIVVINQEGIILVVNRIAEDMFGYEKNELNGKKLEILLPQRYQQGHQHHRNSFHENPSPRRMGLGRDLTALRKDGKEFPVEISLSSSSARGSSISIAFISDITWRKKTEEALKQSEEQLIIYATELEKKVKTRTEDLNHTIEKLEREVAERMRAEKEAQKSLERERELNELKSKFVSIASHEFRTPLSTVLSSISLIQQYTEKGDLDKIDKHIQRIKSSVNHLTFVLNDFLSLGKLEEGKIQANRTEVDLRHLLSDVHEEIRLLLKEGQEIKMEFEGDQDQIITDERILRNIIFNLISNASKYSDVHKKIIFTSRYLPGMLEITVQDEGIGIPEADQKYLFERFFRASNVSNIQGTGLGLNIVKRYIELLGGNIQFTSEYGKGSTFIVSLPTQRL